MADKEEWVSVGDRKLKLSNLEKILYPENKVRKAVIIHYYLTVAPFILDHIKGRPLTLIRYPDGISEEQFYQKDKPDWAPEWIHSVRLGDEEKKDYVVPTEKATLVWLANLASLELHQMHVRQPDFDQPDYMVFDLDPADNSNFAKVGEIAYQLKDHLEAFGYPSFIKTSGKKGLHIVVPLVPEAGMEDVFEASKEVAEAFVKKHPKEATLNLRKSARKGRMLIDIYRNRSRQTIVAPYSLRAVPEASVSMPVSWDELREIGSAAHFNITNAIERLDRVGDRWTNLRTHAVKLHTSDRGKKSRGKLPESDHHKSAEQLREYNSKRDFGKTSEPAARGDQGAGSRFVIQRHHATRLHYDLRLERNGALQSWAVPKGLPPRPGIKRLAVETEEHPLEYLHFEGEIPKGEYGGGTMWLFAQGNYEMMKQKEDSLRFRLESPALSGEYQMYRTKKDQWLMERVDHPDIDWLAGNIRPMNARRTKEVPAGDYAYEVKWDGIRAMVTLADGEIKIHSRNLNDVTAKFPELQDASALRANCGLFDGEIVYLDEEGKPRFHKIINRLKHSSSPKKESGSVYCYIFDCLYLDGRSIVKEPLERRKEWVGDVIKKGGVFRFSESIANGNALLQAAKKQGLEGIMAKQTSSEYQPGTRSDQWLKVKAETTADCYVIGYTAGSGNRSKYFGALHLATEENGQLQYRGKVGTGFNESSLDEIYNELTHLEEIKKPIDHEIEAEKETTWVEPEMVVEVSYGRLTENNIFREAVFQRLRPDLSG